MKLKEYPVSLFFSLKLAFTYNQQAEREHLDCIISLTSIPSRLNTLHFTIKSLLTQSAIPKKILLWVNNELKGKLPKKLTKLESDIFEIRFREGQSSHRKLVFSLEEFSDDVIVTCDDDVMYAADWLYSLYQDHLQYPEQIITQECREISYDNSDELLPYKQWPMATRSNYSKSSLLPVGYGGVLYPSNSLHKDTTNKSLYIKLAPKADDLWFKAMSLLKGTSVRRCATPCKKPVPIIGAKGSSLAKTNIEQDHNRLQWKAICQHYSLTSKMVSG